MHDAVCGILFGRPTASDTPQNFASASCQRQTIFAAPSVFHVRERNVARLNDLPEPLRLKGEFSTRARSLLLSVGAFLQPERNLSGEDEEKNKRRRGQHASP